MCIYSKLSALYDVILMSLTGAYPVSAYKPRQIDFIHTDFTFYVRVTKGPWFVKYGVANERFCGFV